MEQRIEKSVSHSLSVLLGCLFLAGCAGYGTGETTYYSTYGYPGYYGYPSYGYPSYDYPSYGPSLGFGGWDGERWHERDGDRHAGRPEARGSAPQPQQVAPQVHAAPHQAAPQRQQVAPHVHAAPHQAAPQPQQVAPHVTGREPNLR